MNRPVSLALFAVVVAAVIGLGGWVRSGYSPEWRPSPTSPDSRPWASEADCYSQLARVQRIMQGQGLIQNHFTVENWPEGLTPSTTAPFDYVILALVPPLALFCAHPLDWAGALVSPLLAIALVAFWCFVRSRNFNLIGRAALTVGLAFVPALIWATAFGRPRHQSLIVSLLAVAFTLEYERWEKDAPRTWHITAGIVWGMVCWTSLYEPLFAVLFLVVFNLIARRRESPAFGLSFGIIMLLALLIEGIHVYVPPAEIRPVLTNWLQFIKEMQPMSLEEFFGWTTIYAGAQYGWMQFFSAIIALSFCWAGVRLWRGKNLVDRFVVLLTPVLMVFAACQSRWIPYACLGEVFVFARYVQSAPFHWSRLVLVAALAVNFITTDGLLMKIGPLKTPNQPSPELAKISRSIDDSGGILAPWWLSPGLLYFSGHPIVSGSSHCGITGIEASAKFYTAVSWTEGLRILRERKVRWIVVWDEPKYVYPLLGSSQEILGLPVSSDREPGNADATLAQLLITDHGVPRDLLRLRAVTTHFKLYEYVGPDAPTVQASSSVSSPVAVR